MRNRDAATRSALSFVFALTLTAAACVPPGPARTADWVRDSLAYLRDSALVDSLARYVPTDSLRALYRRVAIGPDPVSAVHAIPCEGYHLWYTYGHAAWVAEERVRAAEWTPERDSAVLRALDAAADDLKRRAHARLFDGTLYGDTACAVARDAPRIIERLRHRPRPPSWRRSLPRGSSRDSLRLGPSYFEATLSAKLAGRDTTIELAGSATVWLQMGYSVSLDLRDHLHATDRFVITMSRSGPELFSPGSYPIVGSDDLSGVPDVVSASIQMVKPVIVSHTRSKWWGTLVVERADSAEVHGHADIWIHRKGLYVTRPFMPADSLRDTIHITARFRALYAWDTQYHHRSLSSVPMYPHRMVRGKAPHAATTARRLFLDENVPCERLPIYSQESVLSPLPATYRRAVAKAALNIRPDSAGRVGEGGIWPLAMDDTTLYATFRDQTGIRFRKTAPDQVYARVRCTLTLHRAR